MQNAILNGLDHFVFKAVGYEKPPVLAIDPRQSRAGLNEFYKKYSPTTARIHDAEQLNAAQRNIDTGIKYVKPVKKIASYADALLQGLSISQESLSMGLHGVINFQPPSATTIGLPSVYIIKEDSLEPTEFAEFISRFQQLQDEQKPRIVVVANDSLEDALRLISACGDNVAAHVLSSEGLKEISTKELTCSEFGEFIDLFLSEGDGYCASTDIDYLFSESGNEPKFSRSLALMLQIQSLFRCGKKFDATNKLRLLIKNIDELYRSSISTEVSNKILGMKAISNLWISYLSEGNPERIENSLSIGESLGDSLLIAYALKLSPIVTGRSLLTQHSLERARDIFASRGEIEQSVFVDANIIDNNIYSDKIDVAHAESLLEFVLDAVPYIRRSTTIYSNIGISLMLSGNLTQARELFDLAIKSSGPPVNLLTSEVNGLIAEHIDGENIDDDRIYRLTEKIIRNSLNPHFDYHQAVMFGNLWKICEGRKDIAGYIVKILREKQFLEYSEFLDNPDNFVLFAATRSYDLQATKPETQPGVAGAFIENHGLMPASHVFFR